MTPLFACFPVCLTFVALALVALVVVATGMVNPEVDEKSAEPVPEGEPQPGDPATGPPPWWVVVLIFLAVALAFLSLDWIGAGWRPPGR